MADRSQSVEPAPRRRNAALPYNSCSKSDSVLENSDRKHFSSNKQRSTSRENSRIAPEYIRSRTPRRVAQHASTATPGVSSKHRSRSNKHSRRSRSNKHLASRHKSRSKNARKHRSPSKQTRKRSHSKHHSRLRSHSNKSNKYKKNRSRSNKRGKTRSRSNHKTRPRSVPAKSDRFLPKDFKPDKDCLDSQGGKYHLPLFRKIQDTPHAHDRSIVGLEVQDLSMHHLFRNGLDNYICRWVSSGRWFDLQILKSFKESVF